ncbi:conserved membrane protein of unknown function (Cytochrome C oxidase subunit IV prokaryotic 19-92) [Magnetospirillum sp. XM-1]|uniref:cytochrome C oxidase subunit IV family protein n=1 Tax=Magnetospirillum sp. XM-1 TaxID=1663591 RepID=UPI00073E046A|nr:cytochrome C oxidase subunit IV family protein [Magnetospirillum sp. XM-1]CUW41078.1 conserved membrane protein of unknown function (Cytochrome C oxidase subunit IV prokaryotic 19-92) [Magnetospirillum sp. XM-1]
MSSEDMTPEEMGAWGRRLTRAWVILAVLTVISVAAAVLGPPGQRASLVSVVVALAASFIKARQVLDHFLDLRRAGPGWRGLFTGLLLAVLGLCFALYLAAFNR